MSRIAQLRESLSATTTDTGLSFLVTRKEWAEFLREYKYDHKRKRWYPSVRELGRYERIAMNACP
jgi:hypothetical protein